MKHWRCKAHRMPMSETVENLQYVNETEFKKQPKTHFTVVT